MTASIRGRLLAPLVAVLLFCLASPAGAAPSTCGRHYFSGLAPDVTRPALAVRLRELCFEAFAVLHSGVSRTPLVVAERLTRRRVERAKEMEREDSFHAEAKLPPDERARLSDYARSGFDRGHMAPSGDMPTATAQGQSFSLANIVPQDPGSNRCLWEGVENTVRDLALAEEIVWVLTGPVFEGAELQRLNGRVLVPTSIFKAVYLPARREAGVYLAPNAPGLVWRVVSLDELREVSGLEAFPSLPASVKSRAAALAEPEPSNIYGSCDGQPTMAASDGQPSFRILATSRAERSTVARAGAWWGGRAGMVVIGLGAVLAVVALLSVLGRR